MTIQTNASAMMNYQKALDVTAQKVASNEGEMAKNMTDMIVEEKGNALNAEPIKAQDEMLGTVLDMKG